MYQHIVQFRQVCVATTQINSTIAYFFLSYQPTVAPKNLQPTRTRNSIYHSHKIFNLWNNGIPSFGIYKPLMILELRDSGGNPLRELWIWKVLTGLFNFLFWVSVKLGSGFPWGLGLDPGPIFRGWQLLSLKLTKVGMGRGGGDEVYTKVD